MNTLELFSEYMKITSVPHTGDEPDGDPRLRGKTLALINGASWISLWTDYFGRKILPGVKLMNVASDAVQYNFIKAHEAGLECPPRVNREIFADFSRQVHELVGVDVVLITCSTMNRSYPIVQKAMEGSGVPVVQIDKPMMERAVAEAGHILVVATHGPTVDNTQALLRETAHAAGKKVTYSGLTILEAYDALVEGDVERHNGLLADGIREATAREKTDVVVLAQLSMSVFKLSYPDAERDFEVPVLTSAECGFERVRDILLEQVSS